MKLHCLTAVIPISILIIISSCEHQQDLCFDHDLHTDDSRVLAHILFDWSKCPEANPAIMDLYLIPTSGAHYIRRTFPNREGGMIFVPQGHYSLVAFNSDCDNIKVVNPQNSESFYIVLRGKDDFNPQNTSQYNNDTIGATANICQTPGNLWTSWIEDLEVTGEDIIIPMSEAFCRYSVEIKNFADSNRVNNIYGVLYGNHRAIGFNGVPENHDDCGLLFYLEKNSCNTNNDKQDEIVAQRSFYGEFFTLGHCGKTRALSRGSPNINKVHSMTLCFELSNGQKAYSQVDITDQVHRQPVEECHIVVDSLKLPQSNSSSGGLDLIIDDWQTIYIDIPANK